MYKKNIFSLSSILIFIIVLFNLTACDKDFKQTSSWCADNEHAPTGAGVFQGIDVSHFQGQVDWTAVKAAGVHFAFTKATQGNKFVDPMFKQNWQAMKEAGLARGVYHFFKPEIDAMAQANHFIKHVKLEPGDLPPVLDIEVSDGFSKAAVDKDISIWLKKVTEAYGVKPILYSDPQFINEFLPKGFAGYPLWLARYTHKVPQAPADWKAWNFWQCMQNGKVPGVKAAVDKSIYQGSNSHWQTLLLDLHI